MNTFNYEEKIKILGIPGSLRVNSFNRHLLEAAKWLAPDNVEISIYDLSEIPLYNGDLDINGGPDAVQKFKMAIAESDGLMISTPEYNYSIPGILKNALDWASRPGGRSVLNKKPLAIMSTSFGMFGGVRAQLHLRDIAGSANMYDMKKPEMIVPKESEKFNGSGELTDELTRQHLIKFISEFEKWINNFKTNLVLS